MASSKAHDARLSASQDARGKPRLVSGPEPGSAGPVAATIAISTRDRYQEVMVAVRSACAQQGSSYEVIVVDDASRESMAERIHKEFPGVAVYRSDQPRDFVSQRNFISTVARGHILVSIDDDAELIDPSTVALTLRDFDAGDDIGAVAIPYRNLFPDGEWRPLQHASGDGVECVAGFTGTAYAVRRDVFRAVGGFWEYRGHEERDLALRMLQAGYLVRLGSAPPLLHRPSPRRNWRVVAFAHRRSEIQLVYRNAPAAMLPWQLVRATGNGILAAALIGRGRYTPDMARGYVAGVRGMSRAQRRPVDREVYGLHLQLRRRGPLPIEEARAALASRRTSGSLQR